MAASYSALDKISYRLFGGYARENRSTYFDLQISLRKAGIAVPADIYVSRMLTLSLSSGLALSVACMLTALLVKFTSPDGTFVPWHLSSDASPLAQAFSSELFLIIVILAISFLAAFVSVYSLFRNYPLYRANMREKSIDQTLPHAVTFMYAMSSGGMSLLDIFRTIYQHRDVYGEVATESQAVVRGVELLGLDLITSLRQASAITPSDHLKNFFESTATHMESGGDLAKFLHSRSDQFQVLAAQERKALQDMLSMMAEVYVTAFVAGPLFLITILISLGLMSAQGTDQIDLLVYVMIPVGSVLFVWMLIAMGLDGGDSKAIILNRKLAEFSDVDKTRDPQAAASQAIRQAELRYRVRRFLESPGASFINNPFRVLYITVPVAALVFLALSYPYFGQPYYDMVSHIDDILLLSGTIALMPFIIFWELRTRKIKKMDAAIPEFLKRLASFNESGLTLTMAIKSLLQSNLGVLNVEIRKIWMDIEWGADARDALARFEYRVNTASIRRVVTLITRASESSGDIKETLSIAAADAASSQTDREERFLSMLLYVSIIYISFFVFLYILYTLSTVFLPVTPGVSIAQQLNATATGASTTFSGSVDIQMYKLIFLHAVLLQGLFSGIVAGMMGEGNICSGLKHSAIMMLLGYVVFTVLL